MFEDPLAFAMAIFVLTGTSPTVDYRLILDTSFYSSRTIFRLAEQFSGIACDMIKLPVYASSLQRDRIDFSETNLCMTFKFMMRDLKLVLTLKTHLTF